MEYITTAHQAELNAAAKMRAMGYIDAVSTTGGSDGGIDVRSSRALAQVKWRGGVVGRPDLQNLYGARGNNTDKALLFFSASGYSKQAIEYAVQVGIELWVYDPTGAVMKSNSVSHRVPEMKASRPPGVICWAGAWVVGVLSAILLMMLTIAG